MEHHSDAIKADYQSVNANIGISKVDLKNKSSPVPFGSEGSPVVISAPYGDELAELEKVLKSGKVNSMEQLEKFLKSVAEGENPTLFLVDKTGAPDRKITAMNRYELTITLNWINLAVSFTGTGQTFRAPQAPTATMRFIVASDDEITLTMTSDELQSGCFSGDYAPRYLYNFVKRYDQAEKKENEINWKRATVTDGKVALKYETPMQSPLQDVRVDLKTYIPPFELDQMKFDSVPLSKDFFQITTRHNAGGDWVDVLCEEGETVLGGGCASGESIDPENTDMMPFLLQMSGPVQSLKQTGWRCGGHGNSKTTYATCMKNAPDVRIAKLDGEDWTTVDCGSDILIGGGCNAKDQGSDPGWTFQANRQVGNGWQCGGHSGGKTAYAICGKPDFWGNGVIKEATTSNGPDWTSVKCPVDTTVIGGGCYAHDGKSYSKNWMQTIRPIVEDNSMQCGGWAGQKDVQALCLLTKTLEDKATGPQFKYSFESPIWKSRLF